MSEELVKEFYSGEGVREWRRFVRDPFHRLEFDTTMLFLKKFLPNKGLVLDAGGGPGRYTIELAKLGFYARARESSNSCSNRLRRLYWRRSYFTHLI